MKLKGNRLLALVSMAILNIFAMFALTNSAHAQTLVQTVTQGGVTCKQYTAQTTYPDKYWNCDSTVTPVDARVITTASNGLQAPVKGVLQSGAPNLQLYVFKKAADFAAFFSVTSPPANAMGTIKGNDTAVVFSEAVQDGQTVNLKSYFKPHMHQQLGRLYNVVDSNHPAYGLRFSAAVQYDRDEMDRFTATTVWGATIAGHYPTGTKPSDILDAIYGGTNEDFFAYVFHKNANGTSSTVPALESVVSNYMKTTLGMIKVDVYQDLNTVVDVRNGVICALLSTGYAPNWPSETYQCAHPFTRTHSNQASGPTPMF